MIFNKLKMTCTTLAVLTALACGATTFAQDDDQKASLADAHEQFRSVLDATDNVFYKTGKEADGSVFYTVVWEFDGKSIKFIATLRRLGFYGGKDVYGISLWTYVVNDDTAVPPAVIKAIATTNDRLTLGSISCSKDFTKVYSNLTASIEGLTAGTFWLYAGYLQSNAEGMKATIDEALAGSGR